MQRSEGLRSKVPGGKETIFSHLVSFSHDALKECKQIESRIKELPEHVHFLRGQVADLTYKAEECPGGHSFAICKRTYDDIYELRLKLAMAYNFTIRFLETVPCSSVNCAKVLNSTVTSMRLQVNFNSFPVFRL